MVLKALLTKWHLFRKICWCFAKVSMLRALATVDRGTSTLCGDQGQRRFPGRCLPECAHTFLPESSGKILGSWRSCSCHSTPVSLCRGKKKGSWRDRDSDFYNSSFLQTTYLSNSAKYHSRNHNLFLSHV